MPTDSAVTRPLGLPTQPSKSSQKRPSLGREGGQEVDNRDGIYKPPKLAPMPYTETAGDSKRQSIQKTLSSLLHQDTLRPYIEASSGLGAMPRIVRVRFNG